MDISNMAKSTLTNYQLGAMYAILRNEYGLSSSGEQLRFLSGLWGREITNWMQITFEMASEFIGKHVKGGETK